MKNSQAVKRVQPKRSHGEKRQGDSQEMAVMVCTLMTKI